MTDADLVERRRAEIVEAATRLVVRQGFANTSVQDIAKEAGISVGLLYEYVRTKADILFLVFEYWIEIWRVDFDRAVNRGKDPIARLGSAATFLVRTTERHGAVAQLFYREAHNLSAEGLDLVEGIERMLRERLVGVIDDAIDAGLLRPDTDRFGLAVSLILLCHGWVLKGYLLRPKRTTKAYTIAVMETLLHGWATPLGRQAWAVYNK